MIRTGKSRDSEKARELPNEKEKGESRFSGVGYEGFSFIRFLMYRCFTCMYTCAPHACLVSKELSREL